MLFRYNHSKIRRICGAALFTQLLFPLALAENVSNELSLEEKIAQKLILDLRYYCGASESDDCKEPLTQLPQDIASLIAETGIGGIILFAENLVSNEQILKLNRSLQAAANRSSSKLPLFIAVDQEGGRVVRLPRNISTSFSGNMAVAATYEKHKVSFSKQTAKVIGKELKSLGFNLNFSPVVDVNINPNNPVIHVRSYGEKPERVAELGVAALQELQRQGIMSSLKHFPGHGDTFVDSHEGLPKVQHNLRKIESIDLYPYQYAISHSSPDMIMTAHIQYPALDDEKIYTQSGESIYRPATLSKKILTDLLRNKMDFKGVIVSDALDMKGITKYFTPTEAVIRSFSAGADIALMPVRIRTKKSFKNLHKMIKDIALAVSEERLSRVDIDKSVARILKLKKKYRINSFLNMPESDQLESIKNIVANSNHRDIEKSLSENSITLVDKTTDPNKSLPYDLSDKNVYVLLPETDMCKAFINSLQLEEPLARISCKSFTEVNKSGGVDLSKREILETDYLVVGHIEPEVVKLEQLLNLMQYAKQKGKQILFVSLRSPYDVTKFRKYADNSIATYASETYLLSDGRVYGSTYEALAKVIVGRIKPEGVLPVTLE